MSTPETGPGPGPSRRVGKDDMVAACGACRREWLVPLELPMLVEAFAALCRGLRCPRCAAGPGGVFVLMGEAYDRTIARWEAEAAGGATEPTGGPR